MLHHRTTDLGERAFHIAFQASKEVIQRTGDFAEADRVCAQTYKQVLAEFASLTEAQNQIG